MFYNAKQFHDYVRANHIDHEVASVAGVTLNRHRYQRISLSTSRKALARIFDAIVDRDTSVGGEDSDGGDDDINICKFYRPWDVVPALRDWAPEDGEYGVGVEVELGFTSWAVASSVAQHIRNWRNIALDYEGGNYPIEATFPPMHYNKMKPTAQVFRYLRYLASRKDEVVVHGLNACVGTHINVSKGGWIPVWHRVSAVNTWLPRLDHRSNLKYFGRDPYGFAYTQCGKYIEYKLFNSQLCPKRLQQYIDIAVSLTELMSSEINITEESVMAALEAGWNKLGDTTKKKLARPVQEELFAQAA